MVRKPLPPDFFLNLAKQQRCVPLAVDVVAHQHPNAKQRLTTGPGRGEIMLETAEKIDSPWVFSWMNLIGDKLAFLQAMGVPESECEAMVLREIPNPSTVRTLDRGIVNLESNPLMRVQCEAIRHAADRTSLPVIGSVVGSMTLVTQLMGETAIFAFMNHGADPSYEDEEVNLLLWLNEYCKYLVRRSVDCQIAAGASAVLIANPAAQEGYLPKQMPGLFEEFVVAPTQEVRQMMDVLKARLMMHDCAQLCPEYIRRLGEGIRPDVLSLGSSQPLWEAAKYVPKDVVLYGASPSKRFAHDESCSVGYVQEEVRETRAKMADIVHPYIAGSECDILHVDTAKDRIWERLQAMISA